MRQTPTIPPAEITRQLALCDQIHALLDQTPGQKLAFVDTYGCQQNEADSEKLRGYLRAMGFDFTQDEFAADVVVMNTCAVREHAETRVFGNVGALTHTKARNPEQIIAVCGCMAQQEHVAEKLKKSYRIVDLVFGPHELWRFPELLQSVLTRRKRIFFIHTLPNWQDSMIRMLETENRCELVGCDITFDSLMPLDPDKPFESMARRLLANVNGGRSTRRIDNAIAWAKKLNADGVIVFCHWGCKQTSGASQLARQTLEAAGFPTLVLDGDGCDAGNANDGQMVTRLQAFLEQLEGRA